MRKTLFYLLFSVPIFFGTTSCGNACKDKAPISWGNDVAVIFTYGGSYHAFKLTINDNYYLVNSPKLDENKRVGPNLPITRLSEIFDRPKVSGVTQNSKVEARTTINVGCYDGKDNNETMMKQIYTKMGLSNLTMTPKIHMSGHYNTNMGIGEWDFQHIHLWTSSRGAQNQTYTLNVTSGPYQKEDIDDNWYDLKWIFQAHLGTFKSFEVTGTNEVTIKNLTISGAPVNVTPNKPFIHHIYLDGSLKPYTLENVSMPNDMMTLKVK